MAKKSTLGKWISRIKLGAISIPVRGKTKKAAKANAARFVKKHIKNVMKPTVRAGHKTRSKKRMRICPGCGKKKRYPGAFTYCGTCQPRTK